MGIQQVYEEGRLIRNKWCDVKDGKQLLCLYTAMVDDPNSRPVLCPADVCPKWLAYLLPWMDDAGTMKAWPGMVQRVIKLAPHFGKVRNRVAWQIKLGCLESVMRRELREEVLKFYQKVKGFCHDKIMGLEVSENTVRDLLYDADYLLDQTSFHVVSKSDSSVKHAVTRVMLYTATADDQIHRILDLIEQDLKEQGILTDGNNQAGN